MRLQLILARVELTDKNLPSVCPYKNCQGRHFRHHQQVDKAVKDTHYEWVSAERYECLRCKRTFRVYPQGVTRAQTSQRVKGLGVLLYLLGLSYGATSLALEALGVYMCKTSVYEAVQATAEKVPGLKRKEVFDGLRTPALGSDLTSVKCNGAWLHLGLTVDDTKGLVLSVDELPAEDAETIQAWLEPIAEAVAAQLLVSDDADAFKTVADELGLEHQACKGHVKRNTETFIESLKPPVASDADGSLAAIGVPPEQALEDLKHLGDLILSRQPEEENELQAMHQRYTHAPPPAPGQRATVAYRLRLMFLDRWNLWRPLTRYRTWQGPQGERVDGTNNACERAIGWWIKERYRTMRGYKRPKSAVNVSRLLAWCGNHLERGGADLALLIALAVTPYAKIQPQSTYSLRLPNSERSRYLTDPSICEVAYDYLNVIQNREGGWLTRLLAILSRRTKPAWTSPGRCTVCPSRNWQIWSSAARPPSTLTYSRGIKVSPRRSLPPKWGVR